MKSLGRGISAPPQDPRSQDYSDSSDEGVLHDDHPSGLQHKSSSDPVDFSGAGYVPPNLRRSEYKTPPPLPVSQRGNGPGPPSQSPIVKVGQKIAGSAPLVTTTIISRQASADYSDSDEDEPPVSHSSKMSASDLLSRSSSSKSHPPTSAPRTPSASVAAASPVPRALARGVVPVKEQHIHFDPRVNVENVEISESDDENGEEEGSVTIQSRYGVSIQMPKRMKSPSSALGANPALLRQFPSTGSDDRQRYSPTGGGSLSLDDYESRQENLSESDRMLLEKRALWLRKEQARKKRAAEVAARPISENARLIGQLWMSMIQRTAAREFVKSIRGDTPTGTSGGRSGLDAAHNTSHREDTAHDKARQQQAESLKKYKQEVEKLTAQTESDRTLLQELIKQKELLESEERETTERVWRTRRAILDKKAELEALEQQRGGVDRESAMLAEEVLRLKAEVGQYDARKAEVNATIAGLKRALQQSEKDEGELLEESTRIRRLKLGAENQRREYAKEIIELKDVLRQAQEQAELLRTEANAMQDLVDEAQNSVNGRKHVLEKLSDTLQQAQEKEKSTINDLQGAIRAVDECERSISMSASRIKASNERKRDLDAEVDKAAAAAAAAESELIGYENDAGSLMRQHQQRLQQAKNEIGVHRKQQDKLKIIESQEEEEVKALQQSNRVSEIQIMSLMKEKDAALARIADDKKLTAAARAERDGAVTKQQAVAAEAAALQIEIDRLVRETSETAARRDALHRSVKEKEQMLEGTHAAVNEAIAKLEEKRAEEANSRAALAETYARIRELENKIALGLSVKSDEVIKEQQLVLQLNISKQDAIAKSEVITSLMAATRETEIRLAAADAEINNLGQKLEDMKALELSKSARIKAKTQQLEDEQLVIAELKKAREVRDGELVKELEAARSEKNLLARRDYDLDDQLKKAKAERDEIEKRCKARGVEIERFLKLKESLSKREPAQQRELERVTAEFAQLQKASDERGERVVALRESIKSMESGSQEALSSASEHRKAAAELQGKLQIAQEEEAQAIKLVKTLQSKLAAASAATTAMAADQALLAASLEKLNAREKELIDSKGFMEGKRSERVKQVTQLEESMKTERSSVDKDVLESKSRVAELQTAVQRLGQKRAELHAQEQQLQRERSNLVQQFESESNALYEATKHVSELQLRLDSVKQEAGVNKVKLQALVADWDQVQAEGGAKSLSAADAELKRKVECMHEGQAKIALLKNQTQEAEAALAAMETEIAAESSKDAALKLVNAELKRQCTEAQALLDEHARVRAGFEAQLDKIAAEEKTISVEIQGFEMRIKEAEVKLKEREKDKLGTKASLAALEIELQSSMQQLANADSETKSRIQALQQQKAALEEESKGLRAELESLQSAAAATTQERTLLAASQQEAIEKLAEARHGIDALRASEAELVKQVAAAAEEHDAVAVREAKLQGELDTLRLEIEGGSSRGELLQEEIDRLLQQRTTVTAASSPLVQQLDDMRRSLASALVERDAVTSELRDAEQRVLEMQHDIAASARQLSEVQEREAAAVSEFNRTKTTLAAAEADHKSGGELRSSQLQQLQSELQGLEGRRGSSEQSTEQLLQQVQVARESLKESVDKCEAVRVELFQLQASAAEIELQSAFETKSLDDARVRRGNTVAARDAAAAAHMLVEAELSNAEATLTELKIASEAAHGGVVKVQGDIAVMMRENEAQQQLLRELQAQKEALEAALSGEGLRQLQAEIDSLRERGKAAGGNIMLLEAELRRLREDATEDNRQKESLLLQIENVRNEVALRQGAVDSHKAELSLLETSKRELEEQALKLLKEMDSMRVLRKEVEQREVKLKVDAAVLQRDSDNLARREEDRKQELAQLQKEADRLAAEEVQQLGVMQDLKQQMLQRQQQAELLAVDLKAARSERDNVDSSARALQEEISGLHKTKSDLNNMLLEQQREIEKLMKDIKKGEKKRKEQEEELAKLLAEKQQQKQQQQQPPLDSARSMMSHAAPDTARTSASSSTHAEEEGGKSEENLPLTAEERKEWEKAGQTPLDKKYGAVFSRTRHGRYNEVERLFKSSVPVDSVDENGNTVLMHACQNGRKRIARLALRYGANINHQNKQGQSCLHFAFVYGYGELGDYLISKGANASIKNKAGLTCYEGLDETRPLSQTARSSKD